MGNKAFEHLRVYQMAERLADRVWDLVANWPILARDTVGKQIIRAGLEDHFCGKLLGLPLGVDVCYTNHAEADQDDMDNLLTLLAAAGVTFIMGVPGADDVMLNYQSTSFHDALYIRDLFGLKRAPEFGQWLFQSGLADGDFRLTGNPALLPDFASRLIA